MFRVARYRAVMRKVMTALIVCAAAACIAAVGARPVGTGAGGVDDPDRESGGAAHAPGTAPAAALHVSVATFNIWQGGRNADPDEARSRALTLEAMRRLEADILCIQEQKGLAGEYAAALSMNVFVQDDSTAVLTRWEIVEPTPNKWGARLCAPDGTHVWVFNVHFPAAPYQPYQLESIPYHDGRFISTTQEAITEARLARGENALRCLREMQPALRSGEPVLLCGDFNEPSCLDWTRGAVGAGLRVLSVDWPTTRLFHDAGLRDAYRAAHPDPVLRPGHTWTPRPEARDVMDRIDLVLFAGEGVEVVNAEVAGERGASDRVIEPWPSDHRAVRAVLRIAR